MIPTVGFNMRKITKGNVTIKLWDIGGQVCSTFKTDLPFNVLVISKEMSAILK